MSTEEKPKSKRGGARPGAGRKRKSEQPPVEVKNDAKPQEAGSVREFYNTPMFTKPADETPLLNARDGFTAEQIARLKASPYVRQVTAKTVSYTLEFKEMAWRQYVSGISPPQIFANAGFDLDALGDTRIYGLLTTIRRTKERNVPLTDGRETREQGEPPPPIPETQVTEKTLIGSVSEKDIRRLMHEVAYMSQELAFIKKITATVGRTTTE